MVSAYLSLQGYRSTTALYANAALRRHTVSDFSGRTTTHLKARGGKPVFPVDIGSPKADELGAVLQEMLDLGMDLYTDAGKAYRDEVLRTKN